MTRMGVFACVAVLLIGAAESAQAGATSVELSTRSATPGATLSLSGKGFGNFKSTQINKVMFGGVPALV
ncbi:MAG: hypothetical protein ACT4O4_12965, partial [Nitrospiraceae bacterium]